MPRRHEVEWGVHLSFLCPELIEFCGHCGFTWLLLDAEHQPLDHRAARDLARAADVVGMFCVVRVPEIRAAAIEGFLDVGVRGILAPSVATADDARALVSAVKFSPEGARGSALRSRAASYGLKQNATEYYARANRETFAAALIESQSGVDHLEEITAVVGIDYVALGTNDLTLSLGIHAVDRASARIQACGKPQLAVVSDAAGARAAAAAGATLVAVSDMSLFAAAGGQFLHGVRGT